MLAVLAICSGCAVKERVIFKTLPPQIIERHFLIPAIPIQVEKEEPKAPSKGLDIA